MGALLVALCVAACSDPTTIQVDTDAATGTLIDPSGGTVTSDDGNLQLTIPPGALLQGTRISITRISPAELGPEFAGVAVDQAFELGPDGLSFATPITIRLATTPVSLDGTGAVEYRRVQLLTSRDGAVEELGEVTLAADLTGGSAAVVGTLSHFSPLVLTQGGNTARLRLAFPGPAGPDGVYETTSNVTNSLLVGITGPSNTLDTQLDPDQVPGSAGDSRGAYTDFAEPSSAFRSEEFGFFDPQLLAISRGISTRSFDYRCRSSVRTRESQYEVAIVARFVPLDDTRPFAAAFLPRQVVRCLPSLADVTVDPNPVVISAGDTVVVAVSAKDRNSPRGDPIPDAAADWSLGGASVARIDGTSTGTTAVSIEGFTPGTDTLTIQTNVPIEGDPNKLHMFSVPVTVVEPTLTGIRIEPTELTVPNGRMAAVRVFGQFEVGQDRDITSDASITTAAPAIASAGLDGTVTGNAEGSTTLTATFEGFSATIPVTVGPPVIDSYRIEPQGAIVGLNQIARFRLIAELSDGSETEATEAANWSFSTDVDGQIEVSNEAGSKGVGRATMVGTAIVLATVAGEPAFAAGATVVGPEAVSIRTAELQAITPPLRLPLDSPSVPLRLLGQFASETGFPDDDFTELAFWDFASDDASVVANVSDDPGTKGLLSPANIGTGTVSAGIGGVGTATLAVDITAELAGDTLFDELFVSNNLQVSFVGRRSDGSFTIVLEPAFFAAPDLTPQDSPAVSLGFSASAPPVEDVTESCIPTGAGSYCTGVLMLADPDDPLPSLPTLPALATTGAGSATFVQPGDDATQVDNVTGRGPLYDPISDTLGLSIADGGDPVDEVSVPIGANPFANGGSIIRTLDGLDTVLFLPDDFATLRIFIFLADGSVLAIEPEAGAGTPVEGGTELPLAPEPIQDMIADAGGVRADGDRQIIITVGRSSDLDGAVPDDPDRTVPGGGGYALPIPREQLDPPAEACPNRPSDVRCVAGPDEVRLVTNRNGQVGMFDPVNGEFLEFFLGGSAPNFIVDDGWEMTQGPDNCLVVADDDNGVWLYDTDASRIVTDGLGNTLNIGSTQPLIDERHVRGLAFGESPDGTVNHLYLSVRADFDNDSFPDDGSRIIRYDYAVTGDAVLSNRTVLVELAGAEFNDVLVVDDRVYVGDQAPDSADVAQDLVRIYALDGSDLGLLVDDSVTPYQLVPLLDGRIGLAEFGRVRNRIVTPDGETIGVYPTNIDDPGSDRPRGFFPLLGGNYLTAGESEIGVSVQDRFDASLLQQDTGSERFIGEACVFR